MRPHRWKPTRLPHPWDSPGKNTGVGCHFLLPCMKVKSEGKVAQSCPPLHDPMDCSLPGSSVHGISRQEYWSGVPLPSPRIKGTKAKSQKDYKPLPRDLVGKGDPPGEEHLKGISFAFSEEFWTISCFIH